MPAASAPPGASGTGSTGSQHPMQHPISKHPNPAMQFDPNMRSSHREFLNIFTLPITGKFFSEALILALVNP